MLPMFGKESKESGNLYEHIDIFVNSSTLIANRSGISCGRGEYRLELASEIA
jgi:hypothetical protein